MPIFFFVQLFAKSVPLHGYTVQSPFVVMNETNSASGEKMVCRCMDAWPSARQNAFALCVKQRGAKWNPWNPPRSATEKPIASLCRMEQAETLDRF